MTTKLFSQDLRPFGGGWAEWYDKGSEVVVTFMTMKHHLYERWHDKAVEFSCSCDHDSLSERLSCEKSERFVNEGEFDVSDIDGPGVYLDETNYGDGVLVDESYRIILPFQYMTEGMCRRMLVELNEEYGRDFELVVQGDQEGESVGFSELGLKRRGVEE